ncbi:MAG TPA: DUF484 family protein [Pasteurellaceae bacterium]|nr:DUF484 family protein [Pasteurellaceae bacterium]
MDNQLTEQQVTAYLRQHPMFFANHLDLLDILRIPHAQKGMISLIEMQLERQREYIKELETELTKFARLAHQEPDIFLGLMPVQQKLSTTNHFLQGIEKLNQWAQSFDLQQAKILLFNDQWNKNADVPAQYWLDRKAFELIRLERFGLRHFYLGELTNREKSLMFLPEEFPIGSVACCLLGTKNTHKPTALLLFNARDARHFHNGQDTTFLKHLVDIVELHLHRWLLNYEK